MRFLIIGASGLTGKHVVNESLSKGHEVTALVRNASSLEAQKGLTIVVGSPLKEGDITKAITAGPTKVDAVFVTLNARRVSGSPFAAPDPVNSPPRLMADSVKNAISAMKQATPPVEKIVAMSSAGTGDSWDSLNCMMRGLFTYSNMRYSREDHDAVDQELKSAQGIKFVEVRASRLTDVDAAEVRVWPDNGEGAGFMPSISRASVAKFMVEAAEGSEYDGRAPVVTN